MNKRKTKPGSQVVHSMASASALNSIRLGSEKKDSKESFVESSSIQLPSASEDETSKHKQASSGMHIVKSSERDSEDDSAEDGKQKAKKRTKEKEEEEEEEEEEESEEEEDEEDNDDLTDSKR